MTTRRVISCKQLQVYAEYGGDVDMYQRRRASNPDMFDEAWGTIADLRQRLGGVVAGLGSARYRQSVEADLFAWTADDATRRLIYDMVEKDMHAAKNPQDGGSRPGGGADMRTFGKWKFTCDEASTREAYSQAKAGSAEACSCNGCRNFVEVRDQFFPPPFVEFLESLGIDPRKDGEVVHYGRQTAGFHIYGGWFHFVGVLLETGDFPVVTLREDFTTWLQKASAPPLQSLKGFPLVQVEWLSKSVPWVLPEEEPK
jgi:hypothetical protein